MQKIKYIVIFTLILALAIITVQLADYQNITSSLLKENHSINKTTVELENEIQQLKEQNRLLQAQVITLEEELNLKDIESSQINFSNDTNATINQYQAPVIIPPVEEEEDADSEVSPNITIDEDKQITGFGLEYKQKF